MKKSLLSLGIVVAIGAVAGLGALLYQHSGPPPAPAEMKPSEPPVDAAALKTRADAGDADAQYRLARYYTESKGAPPNYKEAARLLQLSADGGNCEAMALLGELHAAGQGVRKDLPEAFNWYQKAAALGSVAGQYDLAFAYARGLGVAKNQTNAARWYQLAAEGGDMLAQFDFGQRCEIGLGTKVDRTEAFKWLSLSANQGQQNAATELASLKAKLGADELAEGRRRVQDFAVRKPGPVVVKAPAAESGASVTNAATNGK